MGGEGGLPQSKFFFCDARADQLLQPQGGLRRMRRRRHHQIHIAALGRAASNHEDGQIARRGGLAQAGDNVLALQSARIHDSRIDRHVLQHLFGSVQGSPRQGGPAQMIQPLAKGADQDVINSDDQ